MWVIVIVCIFTILLGCIALYSAIENRPKYHAVIIKAAGYLPGTEIPDGADAITQATSEGGNTHVFVDKLVEKLDSLNTQVKVIDFSNYRDMKCIYRSDTEGKDAMVDFVIICRQVDCRS